MSENTKINGSYHVGFGSGRPKCPPIRFSGPPAVVGDLWTINSVAYTIIEVTEHGVHFDRPLEKPIFHGFKVDITSRDPLANVVDIPALRSITLRERTRRDLIASGYEEGPIGVFVKTEGNERRTLEFCWDSGLRMTVDTICSVVLMSGDQDDDPPKKLKAHEYKSCKCPKCGSHGANRHPDDCNDIYCPMCGPV